MLNISMTLSMGNVKINTYREYIEYSLANMKEPRFFSLQVVTKKIGPLGALLFLSAIVFYFDRNNSFSSAWKYFGIIMTLFILMSLIEFIIFKRGRLSKSWRRNVNQDGTVTFSQETIEKTIDALKEKKQFRNVTEAEKQYGSDTVDLLLLTHSYQALPTHRRWVRIVQYKK